MRGFIACLCAGAAVMAAVNAGAAEGERYPLRPVRLIVTVPPGGAADLVARVVSDQHWFSDVMAGLIIGTATAVEIGRAHV